MFRAAEEREWEEREKKTVEVERASSEISSNGAAPLSTFLAAASSQKAPPRALRFSPLSLSLSPFLSSVSHPGRESRAFDALSRLRENIEEGRKREGASKREREHGTTAACF